LTVRGDNSRGDGPPRRARLQEVAEAAGVSVATASRVLAGSPRVAPATKRAVLKASAKLQYRRDPIARALRTQRTGTIGMLVPDISNPFFAELIEAVARTLETLDLDLLLADSQGSPGREARWFAEMGERRSDGLLVVPSHHHDSREALQAAAAAMPVLQLDRRVDGIAADFVGVDNLVGMRLLVEHLVAVGVSSLTLVSGQASSSTGRGRLAAFHASLEGQDGLRAQEPILGEFSIAFGRAAGRRLLERDELPEAIVCGSDSIALGLLSELNRVGRRPPEDVLIVGFDGIVMSELTDPPLTTVKQPCSAMAAEAARLLKMRLDGSEAPPQRSEIAPELIVRDSSMPLLGTERHSAGGVSD
jgi:LacI family transcriptional regulator